MKKKIVHIQLLPILSGVQRITLSIFQALDNSEYECHLICAEDPHKRADSLISRAEALGVKVHLIKGLKREINLSDCKAFIQLYNLLKKEKFDIVHTHTSKMGLFGRVAAKLAGCKRTIHTIHGVAFHPYEKKGLRVMYYLLEMLAANWTNDLVLVNNGYRRSFWFASRKLKTIYNGIPLTDSKKPEEKHFYPIRIIFVGRMDKQKDPMTLLKALNIVKTKGYNFEAVFVGDGELTETAQRFVDFKGMQDYVKLLGWRDDVSELLTQNSLFCSSSLYEALPLTFCEAGYAGLASIGSDIIGIREVIVNGVTGYLFPPKDYVALADLIIRYVNDPKLLTIMGNNAYNFITEHFDEQRMVKEYHELYQRD